MAKMSEADKAKLALKNQRAKTKASEDKAASDKRAKAKEERESFFGGVTAGFKLGAKLAPAYILIYLNLGFGMALTNMVMKDKTIGGKMNAKLRGLSSIAMAVLIAYSLTHFGPKFLRKYRGPVIAVGMLFGIHTLVGKEIVDFSAKIAAFVTGKAGSIFGEKPDSVKPTEDILNQTIPEGGVGGGGGAPEESEFDKIAGDLETGIGFAGDIVGIGGDIGLFGLADSRESIVARKEADDVARFMVP